MAKKLNDDFIERVIQFYKSIDCRYYVLKIEDLLNSMSEIDYFDFERMLKQYNDYREEDGKDINDYFVVNREDYPQFKNSEEFFEFLNKNTKR